LADPKSFTTSLNIPFYEEHDYFFRLYWIPKLYRNPSRGNNTTCAYSFSRKHFTADRDGIQSYNHTGTKSIHVVISIKYGYWNTGSPG
jgi:hypothetical protein